MQEIKAGDMLAARWGYGQTNISYFKVLKRTNSTVTIQAWEQQFAKEAGYLAEYVIAGDKPSKEQEHFIDDEGNFETRIIDAKPIRRKVSVKKTSRVGSEEMHEFVKVKSYMWAYLTDPKSELLQTHYH